jgi:Putative zinc- or iron-chelating domain
LTRISEVSGSAVPPFAEVETQAAAAARAALPKGLAAATRAVIAIADRRLAKAGRSRDLAPKLAGLACRAGCSWCCHQMVGVTVAERALLAEGLAKLPPADRAAIAARTRDVAVRGQGLDQRGWWAARLVCPLLDGAGRCAVHAVRPLPCRGYCSADAGLCQRSLEGEPVRIPVLAAQWGIYGHAQGGLAQAQVEVGIDPGPYSLVDVLMGLL